MRFNNIFGNNLQKFENNLKEIELVATKKKAKKRRQRILKGIPSSPGLAFGKAIVIQEHTFIISHETILPEQVPSEIERYNKANDELYNQFNNTLKFAKSDNRAELGIFESYLLIIKDSYLNQSIINRIKNLSNAEFAVAQEFDQQRNLLNNSDDPLLKERANEFLSIKENLLATLKNKCIIIPAGTDSIVVAHSLNPADLIKLNIDGVMGIVTELGGITSHASILARNFNIPAVIGVKEITSIVNDLDTIMVDGFKGNVTLNPTKDTINRYHIKKSHEESRKKRLGGLSKLPTKTRDGKQIKLYANVDFPENVEKAIQYGAEGLGLVRTETLLLKDNSFPDVRQLFKIYNDFAEKAYPNMVTLRVFDIGSDKYPFIITKKENNPALGLRGIRYLLRNKNLFRTQVKAILKASANKNVQILLPMIVSLKELKESLDLIEDCKKFLIKENKPFNPYIPVGIMIETPSAALIADQLANCCDFFSIGTNDLTQYTLATDRTSELVADIYNEFHPAILKLIKMTVLAAKTKGIPVTICGDLAGHPDATSILIGLGIDGLSVDYNNILELKHRIRDSHYIECVKYADELINKLSSC